MKKFLKNLLSKMLITIVALMLVCPKSFADDEQALLTGDIGDFGAWTTEHNQMELLGDVKEDIQSLTSNFQQQYIDTGVPIEAKIGVAFVGGLSFVSEILDRTLVRFVNAFLLLAFFFWLSFEIYKKIIEGKGIPRDSIKEWVKRGAILGIWIILLGGGLQQLFSMLMGPIVAVGSYVSGLVIDSVFATENIQLSDTCNAIRQYAAANTAPGTPIDAQTVANIMCVPTRLSEFYYAAIKYGWTLTLSGLGVSAFTFLIGVVFVCLFTYTAFKFAFVSFSVISELFLVIIMLPFTAITETIGKTSYNGIPGQVFNAFLGLFKSMSLSDQVNKFIQTAIYFVSMSIIVAIGGAILANAVALNSQTGALTVLNGDTLTLLISGALVAYIAMHIEDMAKQIGGAIDYAKNENALGNKLQQDVTTLFKDVKTKTTNFIDKIRKK
ncbi:MAG: hypothetical protein IJR92_03470 [Alphaproteobacteria bacterium]|nr:hypothetical protein [Alphaproteobacteria bacterium]